MRKSVKNYLLYGGVSKDEYDKAKPLIHRLNLKTWKVASVFLEILFVIVFISTMIISSTLGTSSPIGDALQPYVVPFGVLCVYMVIFVIIVLLALSPNSKGLLPLIYLTNAAILITLGSIPFLNSDSLQATIAFLVALVALPFFTTDRPLRYGLFTLSAGLIYILLCVLLRNKNSSLNLLVDIILGGVFTVVSIFVCFLLNCERISNNADIYTIEVQRDTDALTGVKNVNAYDRHVEEIKRRIKDNSSFRFAVAIFDINDLKSMNDSFGHPAGDKLIVRAAKLICNSFKHSPVYRIGGDEFVTILTGEDYANREVIIRKLHESIKKTSSLDQADQNFISLAFGVAIYNSQRDFDYVTVFSRADAEMYENKRVLKSLKAKNRK